MTEFQNESGRDFTDISTEAWREYTFPGGEKVKIEGPQALNVSTSNGHRVFDAAGRSHYIPSGWIHLEWQAKPGAPAFVK
jgi:hypothetical protein